MREKITVAQRQYLPFSQEKRGMGTIMTLKWSFDAELFVIFASRVHIFRNQGARIAKSR
jgi:hypothetical protein